MNTSVAERFIQGQSGGVESMLAVSKVCLDTAERLTQLNLDALRDSINEGTAAFCVLTGTTAGPVMKEGWSEIVPPIFERAVVYASKVHELAADTQDQVTQIAAERMTELKKAAQLSA
ncbi:MAG: phasin family protein [Azoarcus sp.]|jgi:phasin family protein|nr:phasin family protein [Azoarcus sp.]MDD2874107.1 phasin family protein [Azoarcus sp.]MDX9837964.1 phasin family protein [Azoarcus sp.]